MLFINFKQIFPLLNKIILAFVFNFFGFNFETNLYKNILNKKYIFYIIKLKITKLLKTLQYLLENIYKYCFKVTIFYLIFF